MADEAPLTILLSGFRSTGKSTMINSLVGKAVLPTGHTRTTTKVTVVGPVNTIDPKDARPDNFIEVKDLVSDDGYACTLIDVPGVLDADEKEGTGLSDESLTTKYLQLVDVVLWTTDEHNALGKKPELEAYQHVVDTARKHMEDTGELIQHGVLVTKYEGLKTEVEEEDEYEPEEGEIPLDKETTKEDSIVALKRNMARDSAPAMLFNAHGRVRHHPMYTKRGKSNTLQQSVARSNPNVSDVNINFYVQHFHNNFIKKKKEAHLHSVRKYASDRWLPIIQRHAVTVEEYSEIQQRLVTFSESNRKFDFGCAYVRTLLGIRQDQMKANFVVMWTILEMILANENIDVLYPILCDFLNPVQLFWFLYTHNQENRYRWNKHLLLALPAANKFVSNLPPHCCRCNKGNCTKWWTCSYVYCIADATTVQPVIPSVAFYVDVNQASHSGPPPEPAGEVLPEDRKALEDPLHFANGQNLEVLAQARVGIWGQDAEAKVVLQVVVSQFFAGNIPSLLSAVPA